MKRKNRGKSAEDDGLFGAVKELEKLKLALEDMYYLLTREYAMKSALQVVARKYRLKTKQSIALHGMSCSKKDIELCHNKKYSATQLKDKDIYIDGFNQLILFESMLSGAYLFKGLDGVYRDTSSIYGNYRLVNQTEEALLLVGSIFKKLNVKNVVWVFDAPVSNSGKIKALCQNIAKENNFNWEVLLEFNPDKYLSGVDEVVITSDAWVLDSCSNWFNLLEYYIEDYNSSIKYNIVNLR